MTKNKLLEWLEADGGDHVEALASSAGTNVTYLWHLARRYGGRTPNVVLAAYIERCTKDLNAKHPHLPVVTCLDMADMCAGGAK